MYEVNKMWISGYAIFPCFTVRVLKGTQGAELTCSPTLQWVFEHFFAPFWSGKIHITTEV